MPNVGIYLPKELQARIKLLQELGCEIKISAVCQGALEKIVSDAERSFRELGIGPSE